AEGAVHVSHQFDFSPCWCMSRQFKQYAFRFSRRVGQHAVCISRLLLRLHFTYSESSRAPDAKTLDHCVISVPGTLDADLASSQVFGDRPNGHAALCIKPGEIFPPEIA